MASNGHNNENPGANVQPPAPKAAAQANGVAPQDGDADNADAQSNISENQLVDPPQVTGGVPPVGPQFQVDAPPAKQPAAAAKVQAPAVITQANGANQPLPPPQPVQSQPQQQSQHIQQLQQMIQ